MNVGHSVWPLCLGYASNSCTVTGVDRLVIQMDYQDDESGNPYKKLTVTHNVH